MGRKRKFDGKMLRSMREATGFTQEQWGGIIGLSRETVSAIENNKPGSIDKIGADTLAKWFEYSSTHLDNQLKSTFESSILKYFGFWRK